MEGREKGESKGETCASWPWGQARDKQRERREREESGSTQGEGKGKRQRKGPDWTAGEGGGRTTATCQQAGW